MAGIKYSFLILAVTVLCVTYIAKSVKAVEMKCKGMDIQVTEEQIMNVKECLKAAGAAMMKDLNPESAGCFARCVMEKKSLIDASGKPHKENINNIIDQSMPAEIAGVWKGEMEKCLDNEGMLIKNAAEDPTCKSFLPLSMCTHQAFMRVCQ